MKEKEKGGKERKYKALVSKRKGKDNKRKKRKEYLKKQLGSSYKHNN